jgi:sortase A
MSDSPDSPDSADFAGILRGHAALWRWLPRVLLVVGALGVGVYLFAAIEARVYKHFASRELAELRQARDGAEAGGGAMGESAPAPPEIGELPEIGDPLGMIEIPRLDLSEVVVEGIRSRDLRRAVGHVPGTALPGTSGNVAIAGHRDRHFRSLKDIAPGDRILLKAPWGSYGYTVETIAIVEPSAVEYLEPTAEPALTLITCYPFYYVGHAPKRFIVRAR